MHNFNEFVKLIKIVAMDAFEASKPTKIEYGEVISTSPLQIKVDQKKTLTKAQLVLSGNVVSNNILKLGAKVILIQDQGGQKYIVMDGVG